MPKTPISVFIITLNESATIEQAIMSVQQFSEVIVVDSGSTDGTQEIAKACGARVLHQDWLGYSRQKSFAMSQCHNEWCFNLDGDEVISAELADQIQELVECGSHDALRLRFEDIFMQREMHPASHKRSIVRIFKRSKVTYPKNRLVHENVTVDGQVETLKECVVHYGYADNDTLMSKQNTYSSLAALQKHQAGKKSSTAKLILVFPLMFIKEYLIRKMFLSGRRGLIHAVISSMYAFLKEAKLYELEQNNQQKHK